MRIELFLTLVAMQVMGKEHQYNFDNVVFLKNYDGDTITVEIPGYHPLLAKNMPIRIAGIDTPEMRSKNPCEKEKALKAKAFVFETLSKAKNISLVACTRGKYFRLVCEVKADGRSIGADLIEAGLAVSYNGGSKKIIDWCEES